jgi:hypothetical protein
VFPPSSWKRLWGKIIVSGWPFQILLPACWRYKNPCRTGRGHWPQPWHGRCQWPFPTLPHGSRFLSHLSPYRRYPKAVLSLAALLGAPVLAGPAALPSTPPDMAGGSGAGSRCAYRCFTDRVMGRPWRARCRLEGSLRSTGVLEWPTSREDAHHRPGVSYGAVVVEAVPPTLCAQERTYRQGVSETMTVIHTVNKWVSRSPTEMAELRRLYQLYSRHRLMLEMRVHPSALNLYADRLLRSRRVTEYLPRIKEVPESWC